jgi:predicted nucleotidyltransferase
MKDEEHERTALSTAERIQGQEKDELMKSSPRGLAQPTLEQIYALAQEIARKFHPQRIVLFGSYAYGTPTRDSDVDLLVVMRTQLRPVEQATAIRGAVDVPFPMDLLVRTPKQLEQRLHLGDSFVKDILSRGTVLYEADRA